MILNDMDRAFEVREKPMSVHRLNMIIDYVLHDLETNEKILEKLQEQHKDTKHIEYKIQYAKYVLGLIDEMPKIKEYFNVNKTTEDKPKSFELVGTFDQGAYVCPKCGYGNYTYGFSGICKKCGFEDLDKTKYR